MSSAAPIHPHRPTVPGHPRAAPHRGTAPARRPARAPLRPARVAAAPRAASSQAAAFDHRRPGAHAPTDRQLRQQAHANTPRRRDANATGRALPRVPHSAHDETLTHLTNIPLPTARAVAAPRAACPPTLAIAQQTAGAADMTGPQTNPPNSATPPSRRGGTTTHRIPPPIPRTGPSMQRVRP